ncbi:MAG: hypothetical protein CMK89_13935 [Pseudomonadales bacterium]|nr:hypothetical protein [Pseudomonadales bacterium]RLU03962.1 MAG: hypothetical protein D9N11_01555 [Ketobacter sp.]
MIKNNIAVSALAAVLVACGGGSGSDSEDTARQRNLVGTWIQASDHYYTATGETFELHRQTIIVTDEGNFLEFTDCIAGTSLMARVDNDFVEFYSAGVTNLRIIDDSTLRAALSFGSTQTDVELKKISSDTSIELADVALIEPATVSNWDQVCVETILDQFSDDEVKLKAVNETYGLAVALNLVLDGDITATTYDFSTGTNDATGSIASPLLNANVFDPTGTITVVDGATTDFAVDLAFENSVDNSLIPVVGTIEFDPTWFSYD